MPVLFLSSNIVYIDFSSAYKAEMNAGAAVKDAILQRIVNTITAYYQVSKGLLTIDGAARTSEPFKVAEGKWFTTDF